jgi:hypothetical protein
MKKSDDKKLLVFWSQKVKEEAGNKCELCGNVGRLNSHHFYGRKNKSTRYWLENGICLCFSCHTGSVFSAHESPSWFEKEMLKIRGELWFKDLTKRWNKISKPECDSVKKYLNGEKNDY